MAISLSRVPKDRCFPGYSEENEGKWNGNFVFIHAADTQLGLIDNWAGNPIENNVWEEEIQLTKKAIEQANRMIPKPKFFIVCGDLVDAMPNTQHRDAQVNDFKTLFQELDDDIPLVCVCGNHDIGNEPTKETLANYQNNFGNDYFSFWVGGVFFIVLNSQFYENHTHVEEEYKEQEKWLDEQLEVSRSVKCKHCIVFQHIPWFLKDVNEEDEYFNICTKERKRMLNKFRDAGVKHIFCGHYHRNAGGFYGELELVVTSAIGCQLGDDKSGMRVVRVAEDKIEHKYYSLDTTPHEIDLDEKVPLP